MIEGSLNSLIAIALKEALLRGEKGLIPYIMAGDPGLDTTVELAVAMASAGADVLELGVPFSDPVADGPAIQSAAQRSLAAGTKLKGILESAGEIRRRIDIPLVLMTYYNPVYQYGVKQFINEAARVGVNGLIVPDLPPEESAELLQAGAACGVDLVPLVTPNTPARRLELIARKAGGFIYCVSVTGVTGERREISAGLPAMTSAVRRFTKLPVAVGFGISGPEQAAETARFCDAVVVGSALVKTMAERAGSPELVPAVAGQVRKLKDALTGREVKKIDAAI